MAKKALGPLIRTTTVRIPSAVYEQAKRIAQRQSEQIQQTSLNDLIVRALQQYLKGQRRREIDAAFAGMAEDADYRKQAQAIAEDFSASDWEALQLDEARS